MSQDSICGKCGNTLPEDGSGCAICNTQQRSRTQVVPAAFAILLMLSSLLMLGTSFVNVASAPSKPSKPAFPDDQSEAAYKAAKQFLQERVQGSHNLSEFSQSMIDRKGNLYNVIIAADEMVNARPTRKFYDMQVEFDGASWQLRALKQ